MSERGPRAGWTYGDSAPCSGFLFGRRPGRRGPYRSALLCFGLFGAGAAYLSVFAPWKHRDTPLWKPYLGFVFLLCAASVGVFVAVHDVVPGRSG